MDKKVKYWLDTAHYDLDTAQAMLDTGKILTESYCKELLNKTRGIVEWIKEQL